MFEIGGKRVEVLGGLVHHAEDTFNRPFGLRLLPLGGASLREGHRGFAAKAAKSCQGKKRQPTRKARPRTKPCCVPHRRFRNPNIYKKMREPAVPFRSGSGMAIGSDGATGFAMIDRGGAARSWKSRSCRCAIPAAPLAARCGDRSAGLVLLAAPGCAYPHDRFAGFPL